MIIVTMEPPFDHIGDEWWIIKAFCNLCDAKSVRLPFEAVISCRSHLAPSSPATLPFSPISSPQLQMSDMLIVGIETLSAVVRLVGGLPNEELRLFLYFCLRLTLLEFVMHVAPQDVALPRLPSTVSFTLPINIYERKSKSSLWLPDSVA